MQATGAVLRNRLVGHPAAPAGVWRYLSLTGVVAAASALSSYQQCACRTECKIELTPWAVFGFALIYGFGLAPPFFACLSFYLSFVSVRIPGFHYFCQQ